MRFPLPIAAAALLALTPLPLLAQDNTATEGDTADTTAPAEGDLSLGTPDNAEPTVGQTYIAETFSDWELRCIRAEDGNDPCQIYQLLSDSDGNAVAEINIFDLPPGQEAAAGATVITPLETLLTAQVRLAVDDGQAKRYPFSFCTQIGCYARLGFTAAEVEQFKAGASGSVTIASAARPDEPVSLRVSLSGFTAAWNAMTGG